MVKYIFKHLQVILKQRFSAVMDLIIKKINQFDTVKKGDFRFYLTIALNQTNKLPTELNSEL